MAHNLQKIAILFCWGTAFAAGPFSHQLHLKLKLSCTQCHSGAIASASAGDNLLPKAEVCKPCHAQGPPTAIKQPRKLLVTKFSHAQHAKLGNVARAIVAAIDRKTYLGKPRAGERAMLAAAKTTCESCHQGVQQNVKVDASLFPSMSDCLVCHSKVEPPFSCSTCHDASAKLMPASHDDKWLDFHATGRANLDRPSCQPCHGQRFTCRGCH